MQIHDAWEGIGAPAEVVNMLNNSTGDAKIEQD